MDHTRTVLTVAVLWFGCVLGDKVDDLCRGNKKNVVVKGSRCQKFIICHKGKISDDQQCPAGTLFSEETGKCDHDYKVTCRDDTPTDPGRPFMFQNFNSDCFYGAWPGNCKYFSVCVRDKRFDFHCNVGLVMDPQTYMCNYPERLQNRFKEYCRIPIKPFEKNPFLKPRATK